MTYLRAPPEEWTPYLSRALRPLRPVCLAGVSAKTWEGEWKQPQVACMQWWKVTASLSALRCVWGAFFRCPCGMPLRARARFQVR